MNKAQKMMHSFQAERSDVMELLAYHRFEIMEAKVRLMVLAGVSTFYQKVMVPAADHTKEIGAAIVAVAIARLVWGMIFGF